MTKGPGSPRGQSRARRPSQAAICFQIWSFNLIRFWRNSASCADVVGSTRVSARCTAWQGDELLHDDSLGDARQQVHARRSALGVMLSAHGRF